MWQDYVRVDNEIHLMMEYCDGGDLHTRIQQQKGSHFGFVYGSLLRDYIHERKVLHRDLKPLNIFLTSAGGLKLGDFGLARVLGSNSSDLATSFIGTRAFMAPEIHIGIPYDSKADMWALGCCIFEVAAFKLAFPCRNLRVPDQYSHHLQELVDALMSSDVNTRPSAAEVLCHPFLITHNNSGAQGFTQPTTESFTQHTAQSTLQATSQDKVHDFLSGNNGGNIQGQDKIDIVIKTLDNKKFALRINSSWKVLDLKHLLGRQTGVEAQAISIVFSTALLKDEDTLVDSGLRSGSTVHVSQKFLGGGGI
ncbi:serine/threonine-protein kinase Nek4-like 1 [Homarus americanus]|uniref:non-specific serine/threonine protein kinase n=1 Tax=Homarus americanus TaxID=6706 RepID=A0A8J5JP73_HOMAM|nr:serine/threonine-protein kinase Nek4-like 1 [Homarus americanus]